MPKMNMKPSPKQLEGLEMLRRLGPLRDDAMPKPGELHASTANSLVKRGWAKRIQVGDEKLPRVMATEEGLALLEPPSVPAVCK